MKIRIDTYYDITCDCCSRSWSTDFNGNKMDTHGGGGMGMSMSKSALSKAAYRSGWKNRNGRTLCPECFEKEGNI